MDMRIDFMCFQAHGREGGRGGGKFRRAPFFYAPQDSSRYVKQSFFLSRTQKPTLKKKGIEIAVRS